MTRYKQGVYKPTNLGKYIGDQSNIVYRSSWEMRFMKWCDRTPGVLEWSSEETIIPYICGTDGKPHRYFIDFKIKVKSVDGIKTFLVEIKPFCQTQKPQPPKRNTQKSKERYLNECKTYIKNQSKWKAAEQYAEKRGQKFIVLTEKQLF